jgi:hypothetical protein
MIFMELSRFYDLDHEFNWLTQIKRESEFTTHFFITRHCSLVSHVYGDHPSISKFWCQVERIRDSCHFYR